MITDMRANLNRTSVTACVAGSFLALALPLLAHAQDSVPQNIARALVTQVLSDTHISTGTDTPDTYDETVMARIIDGREKGNIVQLQTSGTVGDEQSMATGNIMYVISYPSASGSDGALATTTYQSIDHYRIPVAIAFILLFLVCVVVIGGKQGIRGSISLVGVICLIAFVLLPGVLHGYSPILLSIVIASLIASIGAYITHGFSRMTSSAVIGMIVTIILATLLSDAAVHIGYLSGITDELTVNLLSTPGFGAVNFQGLLLGGIIIGLLGVLYDAAIGQAVAVEELTRAAPNLPRSTIYKRAFRIGREHIGALVNTLVLAYVGTSLPVFISYYGYSLFSSVTYSPVINQEWFVTEIIRTTVGGIGLMLTIPITTLVAVWILIPGNSAPNPEAVERERAAIERIGHHH